MASNVQFIVAFAAVVGSAEAIRQTQANARRREHRSRKNSLVVHCAKSSRWSGALEGRHVVLSGDKLYVDTGTEWDVPFGHPFAGYYLPFPDQPFDGLVSTICDDPPIMNWIYVDRATHELKFGTRPSAEANFKGPFDCTRQDRRLTLGGWEGFCAVREGAFWALYFDADDDLLRGRVQDQDAPVLRVELRRVEARVCKPEAARAKEQEQEQEQAQEQGKLEAPEVD